MKQVAGMSHTQGVICPNGQDGQEPALFAGLRLHLHLSIAQAAYFGSSGQRAFASGIPHLGLHISSWLRLRLFVKLELVEVSVAHFLDLPGRICFVRIEVGGLPIEADDDGPLILRAVDGITKIERLAPAAIGMAARQKKVVLPHTWMPLGHEVEGLSVGVQEGRLLVERGVDAIA